MKSLLLLSHGQASVERGFSVNKQVEIANLNEDNFVAKRLICDHVTSMGGLKNIYTSNKALLLAASSARRKYMDYLEDERKKESTVRGEKRKALDDEIEEKKRYLEKDVNAMTSSADEYAEKAEKTHQLTWTANSLRRSAKEKTTELKAVDELLDEKLLQLKNC